MGFDQIPFYRVNPVKRLLRYVRPYRGRLSAALVAMLVYGLASAWLAYLIRPIFDEVLPKQSRVGLMAGLLVGVYLLKGIGSYFSVFLMSDVGQRVVRDVRNQLFEHLLGQSSGFFARRTTGQLMSRLTNDVNQIQRVVAETLGDLLRESLALIGYVGLLFYYDARLALVCMTSAPLVLYPLVRLGQRVRRTTRRSQEEIEHLSHRAAEALTGHRIVKAFGSEAYEGARFRKVAQALYRVNMKVTSTVSVLPPLMEFLGGIGLALALWYGSRQIATEALTPGEFTSFLAAVFLMYRPAKKLSRVNANLQQSIVASERIFEILDTHTEVRERPGAPMLRPMREKIEFRDVSFSYEDGDNRRVLRNISFEVQAGQMMAVVGLSGGGKTTLMQLIPRFYDVTGGMILVDGVDVRDVSLASLRSQVGVVTQETVLFDDTIAANIAYASPGASQEEIEVAARAAHAHEFIMESPLGYESRIGERGQRLSGGQRQRIAIARALLKDAPILILDEATSALDAGSELLVQQALTNLLRERTSFVIAHRLFTVRRADVIVVLEHGSVVEMGRHDDLMALQGVYARLYELQLFDADTTSKVKPHLTPLFPEDNGGSVGNKSS